MSETSEGKYGVVQRLIMVILEGYGTPDMIRQLEAHSLGHAPDCSSGAAPSCTCGYKEARNFAGLLAGRVPGEQLLRGRFGANEGDNEIYRQFTDPGTLLHS